MGSEAGREYDFAFSFCEEGTHLYLSGVVVDAEHGYTVDLTSNTEGLTMGANTWCRIGDNPHWHSDYFDGSIEDFTIFSHTLSKSEVHAISNEVTAPLSTIAGFEFLSEPQMTYDDLLV